MKQIELVTIHLQNRQIGIDSREVKRIYYDLNPQKIILNNGSKSYIPIIPLETLIGSQTSLNYHSCIVIEREDGKAAQILTPHISTLLKIDLSRILLMPDYMRKKQNPFFVWGFIEESGVLITLVSFKELLKSKFKDFYEEK